MNPLRCATLVVTDVAATAARYAEAFGYQVIDSGSLDAALAARWGAPGHAGRRCMVMRPASGRPVDLRLVEGGPGPTVPPLRSFGWAAIELCVQDVHATHARLRGGPFEIIGPPSSNPGLPSIHPMQVCGPDGEIVFLTQILQGGLGSGLPQALAAVDVLFIAVLACADMEASAGWVARQLGLSLGQPFEIPYRMLNRAFKLPPERRHRLVTAELGGDICLEFDQYPEGAVPRPQAPAQLSTGVAVVTLTHPDLDAVPGPWFAPPAFCVGAPYDGHRVGVLRMPEGALIEVLECSP